MSSTHTTERTPLLNHDYDNQPTLIGNGVTDAITTPQSDIQPTTIRDSNSIPQNAGNEAAQSQMLLIVPAVSLGVFMAAADTTIIVASYGVIGSDFHALNLTSWIATSYFLSLTSFQPLYGKLSDIFGRKACLIFAYVVFGLGTLACGLSNSMYFLIAGRVVQGIGGGGMTTVVSILFSDIVPLKDRGLWQGIINIVWSSGAAGGVALGGFVADNIGWRWAFLIQPPLCAIALVTVAFALKLPANQRHEGIAQKLRRVDFLGAAVLVSAVFCFLFGMDRGSNVSWRIPLSYAPLATSIVLFGLFLLIETGFAKEPFAPGHVIFERSMFACYACYFFGFGAQLSMLYYLPLFYQAVDGFNATAAGIRLFPAIFSSVTGSLLGGFVMRRTGKYYWVTIAAYTSMLVGGIMILLFTGFVMNNTWGISLGISLTSLGNGVGLTTTLIALIANATVDDQAVATANTYLFRQLGSTIGIAICSTIIQVVLRNTLKQNLGSGKDAKRIELGVRKSLKYIDTLSPKLQVVVRDAYGNAVRHAFIVIMLSSLGALCACVFIREKKLSR